MNGYDRRVLWVVVASAATHIGVERDGVGDFGGLILWMLIFIGCWIARSRVPAWLIVAAALANVLFAAAESRSSLFLACAAWFTCAALGLLALEQRRERERTMLLQPTDSPARNTGSAMFPLSALVCAIPLYLFVPKPTDWSIGGMRAAPDETRSARLSPVATRTLERESNASSEPAPTSPALGEPGLREEAPVAPARPEDGAYGEEFAIDAVARNKALANAIVMYVKSSRPLNVRSQVYDRFENDRWRRDPQSFEDHVLERGVLELPTPRFGVDPIRQTIEVVRTLDATLPHAPGLRRLRFPGERVRRYADDVFVLPQALQAHTTYSVDSELTLMERRYALAQQRAYDSYLDTTSLSGRQRALAQRVTEGSSGARAKALALEAFLRSEYEYSYDTIAQQGYTPLDRFLFETKRGHCEYFASALAMLLRAVDVPSRVATGFSLSAPNPITGYYEVKALDGHAWVEAFVDGRWIMLEPTPFYPLPRYRSEAQVADQLDEYLGRLAQTRELLAPDSLATRATQLARDAWQVARAITRTIAQVPTELGWIFPVALVLGALAAACAYLALLALTDGLDNRELRATLRRAAAANGRDGTLLAAAALEGAATRRGVARHPGTSFREYLAALAEAGYAIPDAFADDFDVARYGGDMQIGTQSICSVRELIEKRLAVDPWPRTRRMANAWRGSDGSPHPRG
jgi:transglutaminase-like putative cysteine protease